jgi:hypothetical protein
MKKFIWLASLVLLVAAVIVLWPKIMGIKKIDTVLINEQNHYEQQVLPESVSTSTILQTNSFYNIKANYPQFIKVDASFNQKIADLIKGKIDTFKKDVKDNWDARNATLLPGEQSLVDPTEPFDFIADWTPVQINDKYISFVLSMYYFNGGAHGINEIYTFNYDVASQKEITIKDFLDSSEEKLQRLSDLAIQKIISYFKGEVGSVDNSMKQWIKEGAGPQWDNFKDFHFTKDNLGIKFQQYQVGAGAFGVVGIVFSKLELEQITILPSYMQ